MSIHSIIGHRFRFLTGCAVEAGECFLEFSDLTTGNGLRQENGGVVQSNCPASCPVVLPAVIRINGFNSFAPGIVPGIPGIDAGNMHPLPEIRNA